MITTNGIVHIKRYMAGDVGTIGRSIAVGVGTTAEAAGNTALDFEVMRADVHLVSYDFVNNKLIFKATLPEDFVGTIYEAGLFSQPADNMAADYGSRLIAAFDTDEGWGGTFSSTGARVGADALQHTPAASGSTFNEITNIAWDFSGYSSADTFAFAYNVGNANTSSITFRFYTDSSNYYTFTVSSPTAGYKVTKMTKGSATPTGSPNWSNITSMRVTTNSTAGGASAVSFDAVRIDDVDTLNPDYVLVARDVLGTPFVKTETVEQDIEIALAVSIS